jgi:hypothetical protein
MLCDIIDFIGEGLFDLLKAWIPDDVIYLLLTPLSVFDGLVIGC